MSNFSLFEAKFDRLRNVYKFLKNYLPEPDFIEFAFVSFSIKCYATNKNLMFKFVFDFEASPGWKRLEFFLFLCHDVFLEVIRWGNRRQLVKLERVGQQFHWNVERWFSKTPFLRLDLFLAPRFFDFILIFTYFPVFFRIAIFLFVANLDMGWKPKSQKMCYTLTNISTLMNILIFPIYRLPN